MDFGRTPIGLMCPENGGGDGGEQPAAEGPQLGHLSLSYRLDHGLRRLEFRHLDRTRVRLFGFLFFGHRHSR